MRRPLSGSLGTKAGPLSPPTCQPERESRASPPLIKWRCSACCGAPGFHSLFVPSRLSVAAQNLNGGGSYWLAEWLPSNYEPPRNTSVLSESDQDAPLNDPHARCRTLLLFFGDLNQTRFRESLGSTEKKPGGIIGFLEHDAGEGSSHTGQHEGTLQSARGRSQLHC